MMACTTDKLLCWCYILNLITGIAWAVIGFSSSYCTTSKGSLLLKFGGLAFIVVSLISLLSLPQFRKRKEVFWFGVFKFPGRLRPCEMLIIVD